MSDHLRRSKRSLNLAGYRTGRLFFVIYLAAVCVFCGAAVARRRRTISGYDAQKFRVIFASVFVRRADADQLERTKEIRKF